MKSTPFVYLIISCLLLCSINGLAAPTLQIQNTATTNETTDYAVTENTHHIITQTANDYLTGDYSSLTTQKQTTLSTTTYPWTYQSTNILTWLIRIEYNDQTYEQQLDISILDFQEKFLKHPEYYESVQFNVDSDPDNDIEALVGFYWSSVTDTTNTETKSLETRLRIRQLPNGGLEDPQANFEAWSELHVNYGLVKNSALGLQSHSFLSTILSKLQILLQHFNGPLSTFLQNIIENMQPQQDEEPNILADDNDHFSIGCGVQSAAGFTTPQAIEKRFAFAREDIFSPTIYQHTINPYNNDEPYTLLFGYQAYDASSTDPRTDTAFGITFSPGTKITTQYQPLSGTISYKYDQDSQRYSQTSIGFSAHTLRGSGKDVNLTLTYNQIPNTMAQSGRWMSFDLNTNGFVYTASHQFDVGITLSTPSFSETLSITSLPTTIDLSYTTDLDLTFLSGSLFDLELTGTLALDMSSPIEEFTINYPQNENATEQQPLLQLNDIPSSQELSLSGSLGINSVNLLSLTAESSLSHQSSTSPGEIIIYYPKAGAEDTSKPLLQIPQNSIPINGDITATATLELDTQDFSNPANNIYVAIDRSSSTDFEDLKLYLPNITTPIINLNNIPARSHAEAQLYWNELQGHLNIQRQSSGSTKPFDINIAYDNYTIDDALHLKNGNIDFGFSIQPSGYLSLDTTNDMLNNTLDIQDSGTGNGFEIDTTDIEAEDLQIQWSIDTQDTLPKIQHLRFTGILNSLKDFTISVHHHGKQVAFDGTWDPGDQGQFSIDFAQDEPLDLEFDLNDEGTSPFDVQGSVELNNNLHYDMMWQWQQGESLEEPGYFKINSLTNEANIQSINLHFTYTPPSQTTPYYGVDVTFNSPSIYLSAKWYRQSSGLPHIWYEGDIGGDLDLDVLWKGEWYPIV